MTVLAWYFIIGFLVAIPFTAAYIEMFPTTGKTVLWFVFCMVVWPILMGMWITKIFRYSK